MGVNCSNSINHDRVQVLSYGKNSLLFLPVVEIEPATSKWFHSEALFNQTHYPLHRVSCQTIQNEFLGPISLMSPPTHETLLSTIMPNVLPYHMLAKMLEV